MNIKSTAAVADMLSPIKKCSIINETKETDSDSDIITTKTNEINYTTMTYSINDISSWIGGKYYYYY